MDSKIMNAPKGKILVVDDDRNILHVIQLRLVSGGYHVAMTTEPEEALKLAENEPFDLALIDLKLNGQDGIQLMENICQINLDLPVI
ncbi:MAG: response regulator, partial [Desulfobacteraceae bacterium]|nr:response regulator [Desulfobacteraceae bacterium]